MIRRIPALLLAAAVALAACGDDDGSAPDTTDAAPSTSAVGAPAVDEDALRACEDLAAEAAPAQATEHFPDNPDVTWTVVDATADPASGLVQVEIAPSSDEVGYPAFKLIALCEGGEESVLLGAYALDGGAWVLLFTTDARAEIDLAPELGSP
ncbi:MAG TPA: hypothetical protein VK007_06580 [Acidimicrobiales bacterium]|nr:hypothetical protein [Acidimicrobiales bacterium]